MTYFYSPSENIAYPDFLMSAYKEAGTLPADLIEMTDDIFQEYFTNLPPKGKYRTASSQGLPEWSDVPPPTKASLVAMAESEKKNRMAIATAAIAPLQDAEDLDDITTAESQLLKAWKKYRLAVNRVDTSTAPDITWPSVPE